MNTTRLTPKTADEERDQRMMLYIAKRDNIADWNTVVKIFRSLDPAAKTQLELAINPPARHSYDYDPLGR